MVEDADHFHFCDGIPLLHGMHVRNRRPQQTRVAKPYDESMPETRMHRALQAIVTAYFAAALGGARDPHAALGDAALRDLDPALGGDRDAEAALSA